MIKTKICGLRRAEDIVMVNEALPDYIGFVFAGSKRQVTMEKASEMKAMLDPRIKTVGVFVNENPELVLWLCRNQIIDIIQLHGDEDEEYMNRLRRSTNHPIIKAIRVRSSEDIKKADELPCDYLLLDTYKENQYGGSGEAFDWSMITGLNKPYFLAGGINASNIKDAINIVKPYAIDVSSGVETDGYKDRLKIIDILTTVRSVR